MNIRALFKEAGVVPHRLEGEAEVGHLSMDSRKVKHGELFVCMPSANSDSNLFIPQAVSNGATAVLTFSEDGFETARRHDVSAVLMPEEQYQDSLWRLCKLAFGNPSASMKMIGVTGTNGKTTTAWLIRDMLAALGVKAGYLGTLGFQIPGVERELANTTPFAIELNALLAEARDNGVEAMAIEVSSHALAEKRVDGIEFDAAVFTNLTQDHLDFHGTMEAYEAAKRRLFTELPKQANKPFGAALNMDDTAAATLSHDIEERHPILKYWSVDDGYDLGPRDLDVKVDQIAGSLVSGAEQISFAAALGGAYNAENLLSATAALMVLGYTLADLQGPIGQVRSVPGRFEPVPNSAGIGILVDYAHTPDAMEKLLDTARPLTKGRLITVFGCGGDRDRGKRPFMARAASERSDLTVITSDNPRTEEPQKIIGEVLGGIVPGREAVAILDRAEAVAYAISQAEPGDTVVIAGKGHENYQIIGRTKYPMDDRELARAGLAARAASRG